MSCHYPRWENVHLSPKDEKELEIKARGLVVAGAQGLGALWSRRPAFAIGHRHRCNRQLAPLTASFVRGNGAQMRGWSCPATEWPTVAYHRVGDTGHLTTGGLMSLPKSIACM